MAGCSPIPVKSGRLCTAPPARSTGVTLPVTVTVTAADTNVASACLGLGLIQARDTASFQSWPAVRWSRCSLTFHLRRCPSMSSIPTRASCRRACACSSTGWLSNFANGSSPRTREFCPPIPTRHGSRRQSSAHPRCRLLGHRIIDFRPRHRADRRQVPSPTVMTVFLDQP